MSESKPFRRLDPSAVDAQPTVNGPVANFGPGLSPYVQQKSAAVETVFPVQGAEYLHEELGVAPSGFRDDDGFSALTDPNVLCNRCVHGFIVQSPAAVANRKPDGSVYRITYGQCLRTVPPMSLDDLRPEVCNQFVAIAGTTAHKEEK